MELIIAGVCVGAIKDNTIENLVSTLDKLKFKSSPKLKSWIVGGSCAAFLIYPLVVLILGICLATSGNFEFFGAIFLWLGLSLIVYSAIELLIGIIVLTVLLGFMTETEVTMDKTAKTMNIISRKVICCSCFGQVEKTFPFDNIVKIEQVDDAICCSVGGYTGFTVRTNQETYTPKRANVSAEFMFQMQEFLKRAQFESANPGAVYGANVPASVGYPPQQQYPPQGYPPQGYPPQAYPAPYPPQGYQSVGFQPQAYPPQAYPPQGYPPQAYAPPQAYPSQAAPTYGSVQQQQQQGPSPSQGPGPSEPQLSPAEAGKTADGEVRAGDDAGI